MLTSLFSWIDFIRLDDGWVESFHLLIYKQYQDYIEKSELNWKTRVEELPMVWIEI